MTPSPLLLLEELKSRRSEMVTALKALVAAESPSSDTSATNDCASVVGDLGERLLGSPATIHDVAGRLHLQWGPPEGCRVLVLGHFDTVWQRGTVGTWRDPGGPDRFSGPGAFDMKAGIVQALFGLASLPDISDIAVLFNSDEEIGSPSSRALIENAGRSARYVLVVEPSAEGGALKVARKGVSAYSIDITGRAAHAGLDPEKGVNATIEAAHHVLAVAALSDSYEGTTVTPTVMRAGTTMNTVPANATLQVDARAWTRAEQQRVDDAIRGLEAQIPGALLSITGGIDRPALERPMSEALFQLAHAAAAELGLGSIGAAEVGGASDGNLTAALGIPTLDGLGPVGGGAHSDDEYVMIDAMPERAALFALIAARAGLPH
ncbi:MAG TPA: M20/M25/M40 family metallo-hydrolase [Actinomycetota bacterium]|nr:M20/M25/M40 family metallo-hydrolase [Actinomycetota bacterium]